MFEDLIYQNLRQSGAASSEQTQLPTGLQVGLGTRAVASARNFSQGNLQQTSGTLDLAIKGNGFLQVTMPDGTTPATPVTAPCSSTRRARSSPTTASSCSRASPSRPMPRASPSPRTAPSTSRCPARPCRRPSASCNWPTFVNPAGLEPRGQNLYAETASSGTPTAGNPGSNGLGSLQQGFLETSNVNVVEELVSMIQTQRTYELNSKAISTSDQMLQRLGQL